MKNPFLFISVFLLTSFTIFAQNTYVPDDNFEQRLIQLGYDDVPDDYVLTVNISGITSLQVSNKNIADLTGIEDFTSLTSLSCNSNNLTSLDVSQNTSLTDLYCDENTLTSLDVSPNTSLVSLSCGSNNLTSLDVSANTYLAYLFCSSNNLTSLDASANTYLTGLVCGSNNLTSLDVSPSTSLTYLHCYDNQLTSLDVSANTSLTDLICYSNDLISLDVSPNTYLSYLSCYSNNLTSLDVSANTSLTGLVCGSNNLTSLDVRNGNNPNFLSFDASGNPNLTCIYVDDKTGSYLSSWTIDANSTFVETEAECSELTDIKNISDKNSFNVYPNPVKNSFSINTTGKIENVKIYDVFGKLIKSYNKQNVYSVSDLTSGVYLIHVKSENGKFVSKLIVE